MSVSELFSVVSAKAGGGLADEVKSEQSLRPEPDLGESNISKHQHREQHQLVYIVHRFFGISTLTAVENEQSQIQGMAYMRRCHGFSMH